MMQTETRKATYTTGLRRLQESGGGALCHTLHRARCHFLFNNIELQQLLTSTVHLLQGPEG